MLGVEEVIIPPASGAASALGFLAAPLSFEQVALAPAGRSSTTSMPRAVDAALRRASEAEGANGLADARRIAPGASSRSSAPPTCGWSARCTRSTCRCRDGAIDRGLVAGDPRRLRDAYMPRATPRSTAVSACRPSRSASAAAARSHAGTDRNRRPPRRAEKRSAFRQSQPPPRRDADQSRRDAIKGTRPAWFDGGFIDTPVYDRYALTAGDRTDRPRNHRGTRGHHSHPAWRHRRGRRQRQPAHHHRPRRGTSRAHHRQRPRSQKRRRRSRPIRSRWKSCGAA